MLYTSMNIAQICTVWHISDDELTRSKTFREDLRYCSTLSIDCLFLWHELNGEPYRLIYKWIRSFDLMILFYSFLCVPGNKSLSTLVLLPPVTRSFRDATSNLKPLWVIDATNNIPFSFTKIHYSYAVTHNNCIPA